MARGDGTGPMGQGPLSGRGMGYCAGEVVGRPYGRGAGYVRGAGFGRGGGYGRRPGLGRGFANPVYTNISNRLIVHTVQSGDI